MSLIKCPRCGKLVSNQAERCPQCSCCVKEEVDAKEKERDQRIYESHIGYVKSAISAIDRRIKWIDNSIDMDIDTHEKMIADAFFSVHQEIPFEQFCSLETTQYIDHELVVSLKHPSTGVEGKVSVYFSRCGRARIGISPGFLSFVKNLLGDDLRKAYPISVGYPKEFYKGVYSEERYVYSQYQYENYKYETDYVCAIALVKKLVASTNMISVNQYFTGKDEFRFCPECGWDSRENAANGPFLIDFSEHNDISNKSNDCPRCGYPMKKKYFEGLQYVIDCGPRACSDRSHFSRANELYAAEKELRKLRDTLSRYLSEVQGVNQYKKYEQYLGRCLSMEYVGENMGYVGLWISFYLVGFARVQTSGYRNGREEVSSAYARQRNIELQSRTSDGDVENYYDFFLPTRDAVDLFNKLCMPHPHPRSGRLCQMKICEWASNYTIPEIETKSHSMESIYNTLSLDPIKSMIKEDKYLYRLFCPEERVE